MVFVMFRVKFDSYFTHCCQRSYGVSHYAIEKMSNLLWRVVEPSWLAFSKTHPTFTIFLFQLGDHDKKQNPFPWTHLDLKLTTQIFYSYIHILPLLEFLDIGLWCQVGITLDVIFQKWCTPWNFVDFSIRNVWMDTIDLLIVHFVELFCRCT